MAAPTPVLRARRCTSIFAMSARCGWFSGVAHTACAVPTMPVESSATMSARSPRARLSATRRQKLSAFSRVIGCMKFTEAPPSTQSVSTPIRSSSSLAPMYSSRRTVNGVMASRRRDRLRALFGDPLVETLLGRRRVLAAGGLVDERIDRGRGRALPELRRHVDELRVGHEQEVARQSRDGLDRFLECLDARRTRVVAGELEARRGDRVQAVGIDDVHALLAIGFATAPGPRRAAGCV